MDYVILRRLARTSNFDLGPRTEGVCRVCLCIEERACPSGCGWLTRDRTICTACAPFAEVTRKECAQILHSAGYVTTDDLRIASGELQEAIEDFSAMIDLAFGNRPFRDIRFAVRDWRTPADARSALQQLGFALVTISSHRLRTA